MTNTKWTKWIKKNLLTSISSFLHSFLLFFSSFLQLSFMWLPGPTAFQPLLPDLGINWLLGCNRIKRWKDYVFPCLVLPCCEGCSPGVYIYACVHVIGWWGVMLRRAEWGQISSPWWGGTCLSGVGCTIFTATNDGVNWRRNSGRRQRTKPLRDAGSWILQHSPVHFKVMHTRRNTHLLLRWKLQRLC